MFPVGDIREAVDFLFCGAKLGIVFPSWELKQYHHLSLLIIYSCKEIDQSVTLDKEYIYKKKTYLHNWVFEA